MNAPSYLPDTATASRFLFFTGKGGVGKTSLSCATALALADAGQRVLIVSTDPASNLDEVFATKLSNTPSPVPGSSCLQALNIDPIAAAASYRERLVGPVRQLLPEAAIRSMEEQLSGACTVEIAAFDEFASLLGDPSASQDFDHVVFDTAPTGHTLRLIALPKAWDGFLASNTGGANCLGPLAALDKQRSVYEATVRTLADPAATTLFLVTRPQPAALQEARRTSEELRTLGLANQRLLINGVLPDTTTDDPVASAMLLRQRSTLAAEAAFLASLPTSTIPLKPTNILGIDSLRSLAQQGTEIPPAALTPHVDLPLESFHDLVSDLARPGAGLIMTMGKGGVGKTTIAATIALDLARRGHKVLLTTTDPAAHIAQTLPDATPNITVNKIDPAAETAAYTEEVLTSQGATMDEASRALLEEDLRSPCTEEIAVFRAFAREVAKAVDQFVVLDTAPTGHTLLLLDASQSYHRELQRQARSSSGPAVDLLARLQDPDFTRVLLVTLPEATPAHEAAALQQDLRRAQIEPYAWIVNQSLLHSGTTDPLLQARELAEIPYLDKITRQLSSRTAWLPWLPEEPVGTSALERLAATAPPVAQTL